MTFNLPIHKILAFTSRVLEWDICLFNQSNHSIIPVLLSALKLSKNTAQFESSTYPFDLLTLHTFSTPDQDPLSFPLLCFLFQLPWWAPFQEICVYSPLIYSSWLSSHGLDLHGRNLQRQNCQDHSLLKVVKVVWILPLFARCFTANFLFETRIPLVWFAFHHAEFY